MKTTGKVTSKVKYLTCDCGSPACVIGFHWYSGEIAPGVVDDDLYIHAQLNHYLPWYRRIKYAFLYALGKPVSQCHWAEVCTSKEKLQNLLHELEAEL